MLKKHIFNKITFTAGSLAIILALFACSTSQKTETKPENTDTRVLEIETTAPVEFSEGTAKPEEIVKENKRFEYPVTDKSQKTIASLSDSHLQKMPVTQFGEVWAYLMANETKFYSPDYPITDIGFFGAGLSTFGKLVDVPARSKMPQTSARVHMVVIDNSRALTHFVLDPEFKLRQTLISSLLKAAEPYDGLQIDFELVSADDKEHYWSFLKELKNGLRKDQMLSVAIPARTKQLKHDAYDYAKISQIVDRIVVMAYDEHWATSAPGAVASMEWCNNVMAYSAKVIPQEKLIMGLPFYGRAWSNDDTAGAYKFSSVDRLFRGENAKGPLSEDTEISPVTIDHGIPTFTVSKNVTYTFYFDNAWSTSRRLQMYKNGGVKNVGFWRLGQEDPDIWQLLQIEK